MSFLMSFALEPEIVTLAWIDNASVQFRLNIYVTKGSTQRTIPRTLLSRFDSRTLRAGAIGAGQSRGRGTFPFNQYK